MTETSPSAGYVFEPGAIDRERLNIAANVLAEPTFDALRRASVCAGERVLDVGCGGGGALRLLAQAVGTRGVIVGLDAGGQALALAGQVVAELGSSNIHLLQGDINMLVPDQVAAWAPFDLALCRLLLTHQTDPGATLAAVARLLRPGGRIIAIDPLRASCLPRFDPPVPAIERITELDIEHLKRRGLAWNVAWDYGDLCEQVGLRLLDWRGAVVFTMHGTWGLDFQRRLLPAQQTGLVNSGLTTQSEIDGLVAEVDAAIERGVHRSTSSVVVTMIAEVPR